MDEPNAMALPPRRRDDESDWHDLVIEKCPHCGCEFSVAKDDPSIVWDPGRAWEDRLRRPGLPLSHLPRDREASVRRLASLPVSRSGLGRSRRRRAERGPLAHRSGTIHRRRRVPERPSASRKRRSGNSIARTNAALDRRPGIAHRAASSGPPLRFRSVVYARRARRSIAPTGLCSTSCTVLRQRDAQGRARGAHRMRHGGRQPPLERASGEQPPVDPAGPRHLEDVPQRNELRVLSPEGGVDARVDQGVRVIETAERGIPDRERGRALEQGSRGRSRARTAPSPACGGDPPAASERPRRTHPCRTARRIRGEVRG